MTDSVKATSGHEGRTSLGQHYLDSAVRAASPARLRLMLLERAVDVANTLASRWRAGEDLGGNELSLKLLDLLTELLSGVTGGSTASEHRVCRQVADLYVFLTQHLLEAEKTSHAASIDEIRIVLEIETATWRTVCLREISPQTTGVAPKADRAGGLNLEG